MLTLKKYNIYIITKTGLHIGTGNANIGIGEMDNPIIKDKEGFPYIPASSLKGKLRSLYELKTGKIGPKGGSFEFDGENYDEISMFFGKSGDKKDNLENLGPTRFIFRDLKIAKKDDIEKVEIESFKEDDLYTKQDYKTWQNEGDLLTEEKIEVSINRKTGTAGSGQFAPRPVERVFAGTVFKGELVVRFFEKPTKEKEEENFKKFGEDLNEFKKLLEDDYLGGMGTRGSGQVEVIFEEIK